MKIFKNTNNPIIRGSAGAGKTSCVAILSKCNVNKSFLYLSFGKENAMDSKERFGDNVTSKTFHAFARQYLLDNGLLTNTNIVSKLASSDISRIAKEAGCYIDSEISFHVIAIIDFICKNPIPASYCTHYFTGSNGVNDLAIEKRQMAVDIFRYYWKYVFNSEWMPITHDVYLKKLSFCRVIDVPFEFVIMDEFQDATPIMVAISKLFVDDHRYMTIRLGDPMQCIFMYQGAIGYQVLKHPDIQLAKSKRCGKKITSIANSLVEKSIGHCDLEPMVGADHEDIVIISTLKEHMSSGVEKAAYLTRYNATILKAMITLNKADVKFCTQQKFSTGYLNKVYDIIAFVKKERNSRLKKLYRSIKDLKNHASAIDDRETLLLISIVDSYKGDMEQLKQDIANIDKNQVSKGDARYILSTIHQSKGSTYNTVIIAADVSKVEGITEEEVYVSYTGITRARKKLIIPKKLSDLIK